MTAKRQRPRFPEALADLPCSGVVLQVLTLRANHRLNQESSQVSTRKGRIL